MKYLFSLYFLVPISFSEDTSFCDEGWKMEKFSNIHKCLKLIGNCKNKDSLSEFDQAKATCEVETGQDLASIHSEEEQSLIRDYVFHDNNCSNEVWIGLERGEKSWIFTDGTPVGELKKYWSANNPSNEPDSRCVEMVSKKGTDLGKLNDIKCDKFNLVLCQKDPSLTSNLLNDVLNNITKLESDCLKKHLEEIRLEKIGNFGDIYKNNYSYFGFFKNTNGKQMAFLIPIRENRKPSNFTDAIKTCARFKSKLVEVLTLEKQIILNLFLNQIWSSMSGKHAILYFWLNAEKNSSGNFIWKNSNSTVSYQNWYNYKNVTYPSGSGAYLATWMNENDNFGTWVNKGVGDFSYVICEYSMN
jgi:hypothetical protein